MKCIILKFYMNIKSIDNIQSKSKYTYKNLLILHYVYVYIQ